MAPLKCELKCDESPLLTPPAGSLSPAIPPQDNSAQASSTTKSVINKRPLDPDIVLYSDNAEQRNSKYQLEWTEVMADGNYTSSTAYKRVEVLLLSWDEHGDDLGVKKEVEDLAAVFKTKFNFGTQIERLKHHEKKSAQAYINKVVANWVWEHDGQRTLLIVYFAGHGRKGEGPNELHLAGRMRPQDYRAHLDRVIWNRTEENLRDTQSDVLEIFDCCYAGNLANPRERGQSSEPRAFEYLAAAPANKRTPGPGETSFTTALIWSLNKLADRGKGRFTTNDLLNTIKREAPGFARTQEPVFSKRDDTGSQYIILGRLQSDGDDNDSGDEAPDPPPRASVNEQTVLTLKFVFNQCPSVKDVQQLGRNLNVMASGGYDFNINRIMWGGLHSHTRDSVLAAASRFQALLKRRPGSGSLHSPSGLLTASNHAREVEQESPKRQRIE